MSDGSTSIELETTMSWWMRSPGLESAARLRSAPDSVSRKFPPTIQKTSISPRADASTWSFAVRPFARGTGNPHTCSHRASAASPGDGAQPTSAPPWTPEWPRIGISPRFGRPGSPRARPTLTRARIVSTPCACWVNPMDQTKCALGCSTSSRAKSRMRSCGAPLDLSRSSQVCPRTASAAASNPVVRPRTKSWSMPSGSSSSAFKTPFGNPRSPPVSTSNQSSASFVPKSALSAIDGTQYRSRPGSRYGLTTAIRTPFFFAKWRYFVVTGWLFGTFDPKKTIRSE